MSNITINAPLMTARAVPAIPLIRAGTTVFLIDGYAYTGFLRLTKIAQSLGAGPNQFVQVNYANNIPNYLPGIQAAVQTLDALLNNPAYGGPKVVCGISMGTQVAYKWIRDISPTSPIGPSQLSFVLLANPENKYTGVTVSTTAFGTGYGGSGIPNTCPYSVQNFVRQYDGVGDYPNQPNPNQTALDNAWLGMAVLHNNYFYVGLNDDTNWSHAEGPTNNLVYTWAQTYPLPLAGGMNDLYQFFNANPVPSFGSPSQLQDEQQRPIIEAAYNRPVAIPVPTMSVLLPVPVATASMLTPTVSGGLTVTAPRTVATGSMLKPTVADVMTPARMTVSAIAFAPAVSTSAVVTFDAVGSGNSVAAGSTLSFSSTVTSGSTALLWVSYANNQADSGLTATYGSSSMTQIGSPYLYQTAGGYSYWITVFSLSSAPGGSQTVTLTPHWSSTYMKANTASYLNVTSFGTPVGVGASTLTVSSATNHRVSQCFVNPNTAALTSYNQTQRWYDVNTVGSWACTTLIGDAPGASSVTFSAGNVVGGLGVDLV